MFDIGLGELVLIFVVFLVLFGPKSLPDLARKIAYGLNKVKQAQAEFQSHFNSLQHEIQSTIDMDKQSAGIATDKIPKASPTDEKATLASDSQPNPDVIENRPANPTTVSKNKEDNTSK